MNVLYKYTSDPVHIFEGGYIRATQVNFLNDPFEGYYCERNISEHIENNLLHTLQPTKCSKNGGDPIIATKEYIKKSKDEIGVVCLTESHDNLLMWSHYADEHKGCVIGFSNIDNGKFFNNLLDLGEPPYKLSPFKGDFHPVKYRKQLIYRNDSYHSDYYSYDDDSYLIEIFQRKSDEWVYEKEHRAILKLQQADKVIIDDVDFKSIKKGQCKRHFLYQFRKNDAYVFEDKKHKFFLENVEKEERMVLSELLLEFSNFPNSLYLFRINEDSFESVIFGFKSKYDIGCFINDNNKRYDLEIWKSKLNSNYYMLDFKKIR